MAVSRVYYHSGLFVEYEQVIVFIDYVERYVFRKYLQPAPLIWHDE